MRRFSVFISVLLLSAAGFSFQSANSPASPQEGDAAKPVAAKSTTLPPITAQGPQLRQIAILDLPGRPGFDSVVFANGKLVIAHQGANTVDIFDPEMRRLAAQISNISDPRGLALDPATGNVYIACAGSNSIAVLSSGNWQVTQMIPLGRSPENLLFVPQTKTLYATTPLEGSIAVIPVGNGGANAGSLDIQGRPEQMAWDAEKNLLYVTVEDRNSVAIVDPSRAKSLTAVAAAQATAQGVPSANGQPVSASSAIVREFPLLASQPTGLLLDPSSHRLYVAVRYAVLQLDPDSGAELARVPAPAGTDSLWLDSATKTLYAAAVDGSVVQMSASGTLVGENEYRSEVRGYAMAYDPQSKTMFLSGGREGRSKLVILKQFGQAAVPDATQTDVAQK